MDEHTYTVLETHHKPQLPDEVILAIRKQRRRCRHCQQTSNPAVKCRLSSQSEYIKQLLLDVTQHHWDSYLESLEVEPITVWQLVRNGPAISFYL